MGMAASQVRLLQLTDRKHSIGYQLTRLSNDKVSLSRDMQKVSRKYNEALNQKVLKWSNNNGVTYTDLTYQNLMKPSQMNQYNPYLLTDQSGKIVLDSKYQEIAKKISPDGKGGNTLTVEGKSDLIAEMCNFDAEKIKEHNELKRYVLSHELYLEKLKKSEPKVEYEETCADKFLEKLGTVEFNTSKTEGYYNGSGGVWDRLNWTLYGKGNALRSVDIDVKINWADDYNNDKSIDLGNSDNAYNMFSNILTVFNDMLSYFLDEEQFEKIQDCCSTTLKDAEWILSGENDSNTSLKDKTALINGDKNNYKLNIKALVETILQPISICSSGDTTKYTWIDIESKDYKNWKTKHAEWQSKINDIKSKCETATNNANLLFSAEEESLIAYYDKLFTSIAEKGWVCNYQINDPEYMNQMLQNNYYTITTLDRELVETGKCDKCDGPCFDYKNTYTSSIASNFNKLFIVNDEDIREQALVDYEYEKSIINQKEQRIDTRMKNLETEQAAINQMMKGLETVRNDNISRTMEMYG